MHTPGNTSRVSIPAMRVRYIKKCVDEYIAFCKGFNSRYAGKIHRHQQAAHAGAGIVSIPAMRVRYISRDSITIRPTKEGFNSRYAGKIHRQLPPEQKAKKKVSIPAMRVRYISAPRFTPAPSRSFNSRYAGKIHLLLFGVLCGLISFNSRYAGKIHQQKQRKTLPLTMASLCKTPFFLFIVYHICLHLSTFYPNFTDFVLIFRRRLVRVSSFSSRFYSGFSGSRTWPVPVPAQNAKDF